MMTKATVQRAMTKILIVVAWPKIPGSDDTQKMRRKKQMALILLQPRVRTEKAAKLRYICNILANRCLSGCFFVPFPFPPSSTAHYEYL